MQTTFDHAICNIISKISIGQVMSYGDVARAAGYPRHARMVSKAMSRSPRPLPWFRVVKSDRTLAFKAGSEPYIKQEKLLHEEGVKIVNGKVIPASLIADKSLDELLWGIPPT